VHAVFTPDGDEIAEARDLLAAVDEADIEEGGVIAHEGRMIDRPLIQQARRTVELADALDG
jgi:citrate lyase subunit beta/citryl-CoA lyase